MQYSQSKVHLNHRWQLQKLWMSKLSYQDAQDKQRTQYQLTTQVKMADVPSLLKIPKSECPRYLDTSTKIQVAKNQGPAWNTQWFPLSEICTVIVWQDYYGKGNSRSVCLLENSWEKKPNLGMFL